MLIRTVRIMEIALLSVPFTNSNVDLARMPLLILKTFKVALSICFYFCSASAKLNVMDPAVGRQDLAPLKHWGLQLNLSDLSDLLQMTCHISATWIGCNKELAKLKCIFTIIVSITILYGDQTDNLYDTESRAIVKSSLCRAGAPYQGESIHRIQSAFHCNRHHHHHRCPIWKHHKGNYLSITFHFVSKYKCIYIFAWTLSISASKKHIAYDNASLKID